MKRGKSHAGDKSPGGYIASHLVAKHGHNEKERGGIVKSPLQK